MPVQLLPQQRTVGQAFGTGLESGISNALGLLTQTKLNDIMQQKQRPGLIRGLVASGHTQQEAEGLADLPPDLLGIALKQKVKSAALAPFMEIFQQAYGQPQFTQQAQEQQPESLQQAQPNEMQRILKGLMPNSSGPQDLQQLFPNQQDMVAQTMMRGLQKQQQTMPAAEPTQQRQQTVTPEQMSQSSAQPQRAPLSQSEAAQMAASFATGDPKQVVEAMRGIEKERAAATRFERKQALLERKENRQEQQATNKETQTFYRDTIKSAKAAKENDMRLDRMEQLNEKGELGKSATNSILKTLSYAVDLSSLMTADAQEFDKLSTDFLKSIKDVFGARITDNEIKQFLKTVPTLTQSQEGRRRIIRNMRIFDAGTKERSKVMNTIIAENGGKRPANIEALVEDRMEPTLDTLSKEFANGPIKESPATYKPQRASNDPLRLIPELFGGREL